MKKLKSKSLLLLIGLVILAVISLSVPAKTVANSGTFTLGSNLCTIEGVQVKMDVAPYEKDSRTYLPIRYVAYAVGLKDENVTWQDDKQIVRLINGDRSVSLQVGSKLLLTPDGQITMDVVPELSNDRVFLPVAFIARAFDHQAKWDQEAQTVTILHVGSTPATAGSVDRYKIINPYAAVAWDSYGQFKASFHVHTTESGGSNQPAEMIEAHYKQNYDILALTDHDFLSTTWDRKDRLADKIYLTSARLGEISAGVGRGGRGMIGIPYSNEQSSIEDLNTFWAKFANVPGETLEHKIARAQDLGGISYINHPGRYTGGDNPGNGGTEGAWASSQPATITYYINLLKAYSSCLGMEIIKSKDIETYSDRILWDNILQQTMPNRRVWGFVSDDAHSVGDIGFTCNVLLMPANDPENVRWAMENGTFYTIARVAKRELGDNFAGSGPFPAITSVAVDEKEALITIRGQNYNRVEWIADGKLIATGDSIDLNDHEDQINHYVRAQLEGDGGICLTQPFGISASAEAQ